MKLIPIHFSCYWVFKSVLEIITHQTPFVGFHRLDTLNWWKKSVYVCMNVHKGLFPPIKAVAEKKSISNASSLFHSFFVQLLRKENLYVVPDEKKILSTLLCMLKHIASSSAQKLRTCLRALFNREFLTLSLSHRILLLLIFC